MEDRADVLHDAVQGALDVHLLELLHQALHEVAVVVLAGYLRRGLVLVLVLLRNGLLGAERGDLSLGVDLNRSGDSLLEHAAGCGRHLVAEDLPELVEHGPGLDRDGTVRQVLRGEAARLGDDLGGAHLHLHVPLAEALGHRGVVEVQGDALGAAAGEELLAELREVVRPRRELLQEAALQGGLVAGSLRRLLDRVRHELGQSDHALVAVVAEDAEHLPLLGRTELDQAELLVGLRVERPEGRADVLQLPRHGRVDLVPARGMAQLLAADGHHVVRGQVGELRALQERPHRGGLGRELLLRGAAPGVAHGEDREAREAQEAGRDLEGLRAHAKPGPSVHGLRG
mmetsp:Transcript_49232/g.145355  ORF Transcript_49232/g.145355 Transcript_49232/m.145355 type:complete len:343 (-) Transcript_49232:158-1186(-)